MSMHHTSIIRSRHRLLGLLLVGLMAGAVPLAAEGQAQSVLDDPLTRFQAERGVAAIYDMQFARAERLFDQVDRRNPDHPVGPFLKALSTWWMILLDLADESHDDQFNAEMEEVIRRADRILQRDRQNFDAMFFKGAALGFRGRLRSNRGEWYGAAMDGRRAMRYVLAIGEHDGQNADYSFGKGIYDYFAALIPDRYPYTRPVMVFFPRGDRDRGLGLLSRTAHEGTFIRTEAAYFLLQIYHVYERDYDKSLQYASLLRERHPDNPFFHTFEARVYARWGNWRRSTPIFEEVLRRHSRNAPGYNVAMAEQGLYFIARGHMAFGEHDRALRRLRELVALAPSRPADSYFQVLGQLRLGMALDALGRREEALASYRRVLRMKDWHGSHETARTYLQTPFMG
jgi:tetratricopeptide (TPR) repeat protein